MNPVNRIARFALGLASAIILQSQAWAGTITYYHNDLTGSPVAATNEAGQVLWRESYRPYGERLTNSPAAIDSDVWFTSRRQDETGLVYMGARYYDPVIGRFISMDPKGFDDTNLHSHNRYAYANNNPYTYKDPNGRAPTPFDAALVLYDTVMLAHAWASGGDVGGAATDLGISAGSLLIPIPGVALAIKAERAMEAARVAEHLAHDMAGLTKKLASEAQMGEQGISIAGPGSNRVFRDAERVAAEHGGDAGDWAKMTSESFKARDGTQFQTRWVENVKTGDRAEYKTMIQNAQ